MDGAPFITESFPTLVICDSRGMQEVESDSVALVVTSPPYWQLKDYGTAGQLGYDQDYEEYLEGLGWEMEAKLFYEAYVSADAAVGMLVDAAPPDTRVMVVSAHGFKGIEESTMIRCDLGPVLTHLGHLTWGVDRPEWRRTSLYVLDSPHSSPRKQVRVNLEGREQRGRVSPADRDALLATLEEQLAEIQYQGTQTLAFRTEAPRPGEAGDLVVVFNEVGVGSTLVHGDDVITGAVPDYRLRTGGHGPTTPGLLIAAGPGLARDIPDLKANVLDIAPTAVHLLGLPPVPDMPGRVLVQGLVTE